MAAVSISSRAIGHTSSGPHRRSRLPSGSRRLVMPKKPKKNEYWCVDPLMIYFSLFCFFFCWGGGLILSCGFFPFGIIVYVIYCCDPYLSLSSTDNITKCIIQEIESGAFQIRTEDGRPSTTNANSNFGESHQ